MNRKPETFVALPGQLLGDTIDAVAEAFAAAELYFGHGADSAEEEACWLVLHASDEQLGQEEYDWERPLNQLECAAVTELVNQRLSTGKPLAYLLNEAWFAGERYYIDQRALVPRSFMAEWIPDRFAPWIQPRQVNRILDLCCGSGCIGIAAAKVFDTAEVILSDISAAALEVAEINIARHDLGQRVKTSRGDMFEGIDGSFDLILCNPPYVSFERMSKLPREYRAEPALALEAGAEGLDFLRPFLAAVGAYVNDAGALIVEAGSAGPAVEAAWPQVPFTWLGTEYDEMVLFMLSAADLKSSHALLQERALL